jgi:BASS family bile acid:Na+ symporter
MGANATAPIAVVARVVGLSVAAPLALGLVTRALAPSAAERLRPIARLMGIILLLATLAVAIGAVWREMAHEIGDGGILAMALTACAALAVGHVLAPDGQRVALALAAATRHPGVALAIGAASFPDRRREIMAACLLFLLVTAAVAAIYLRFAGARAPAQTARPST